VVPVGVGGSGGVPSPVGAWDVEEARRLGGGGSLDVWEVEAAAACGGDPDVGSWGVGSDGL
jgi:hypothetical protein